MSIRFQGELGSCAALALTCWAISSPGHAQSMSFDADRPCLVGDPGDPCVPPNGGQWAGPYDLEGEIGLLPSPNWYREIVHAAVLPPGGFAPELQSLAGKVLFFTNTATEFIVSPSQLYDTFIWDPKRPSNALTRKRVPYPPAPFPHGHTMFCSAHLNLPNGDFMTLGGAETPVSDAPNSSNATGTTLIYILRIAGETNPFWELHSTQLAMARFYPTAILEPNGDVPIFGEFNHSVGTQRELFRNAWNGTDYTELGRVDAPVFNREAPNCSAVHVRDYPKLLIGKNGATIWTDGYSGAGSGSNQQVSFFFDLVDPPGPFPCDPSVPVFERGQVDLDSPPELPIYGGNVAHLITQNDPNNIIPGITQTLYQAGGTTWGQDDQACPCEGAYASRVVKKMVNPSPTATWIGYPEGGQPDAGDPPHLNWGRLNSGMAVLPDGSLVVLNGRRKSMADADKQPCEPPCVVHGVGECDDDPENDIHYCRPARKPERYTPPEVFHGLNPQSNVWKLMAPQLHVRQYHATWGVTVQGEVFSAGGTYNNQDADPPGSQDHRYSVELWKPPYFFSGARPEILNPPAERVHYNAAAYPLEVRTSGSAPIERVAILKNTSVTHATDFQQTYVELRFVETPTLIDEEEGIWQVNIEFPSMSWLDQPNLVPKDAWAIAPPGWYLLTAVDIYNRPSESVWIQLWPSPGEGV